MRPIKPQPEPASFYEQVQKKGEEFLVQHPNLKGSKLKPYWRACIPELREAYSHICAYTCHWICPDTGAATVDHFKPKELYPQDAYRWSNYRLVCSLLNSRKGVNEEILDPFTIQDGWFTLHFPSLQLKPGEVLTQEEAYKVERTIRILKLNDMTCINGRKSWLIPYLKGAPLSFMEEKAPFLAEELKRQKLLDLGHPIWQTFHKISSPGA
ncbi:hypothetical protein [Tengunoibacter tsumagoiensis]|uniref:TIGR02646 family protein n=1 Tax=Tengunoibacter tsumagoiensis TaxID=2014871 RepID=A0A402A5P8_9CHLR|nr:hypothetical protein [Tengunoibacter tsumagoiensis]GCE14345.1 hypothetical protein KTT_42040 [Tengunoibacter tsumagoiensis]